MYVWHVLIHVGEVVQVPVWQPADWENISVITMKGLSISFTYRQQAQAEVLNAQKGSQKPIYLQLL